MGELRPRLDQVAVLRELPVPPSGQLVGWLLTWWCTAITGARPRVAAALLGRLLAHLPLGARSPAPVELERLFAGPSQPRRR